MDISIPVLITIVLLPNCVNAQNYHSLKSKNVPKHDMCAQCEFASKHIKVRKWNEELKAIY